MSSRISVDLKYLIVLFIYHLKSLRDKSHFRHWTIAMMIFTDKLPAYLLTKTESCSKLLNNLCGVWCGNCCVAMGNVFVVHTIK